MSILYKYMTIHFTGIKGVGMAALAQVLQDQGHTVQGSDTKEWFITDPVLSKRGIKVFERFTPRNISIIENSRWKPAIDKLIYTGAHHGAQNVEVKWAASRGIPTINYAKALGETFGDKKQICVCGVGGKTTTTAMLATILHNASLDPSWVIGTSEIPSLPASGKWGGDPASETGRDKWAVIESDEYVADPQADKTPKFMYLNPQVIICTNIHHDHPDVYPTEDDAIQAYIRFFEKLPKGGLLLISSQVFSVIPDSIRNLYRSRISLRSSGMTEEGRNGTAEREAKVIIYDENFTLEDSVRKVIQVPGDYNVKNAMATVLAAEYIGVPREKALEALKKYTGSKRRFELIADVGGVKIYDDYAHHPDEISGLTQAVKSKFPDSKIKFIFQPHTFSRTKALLSEFARSLIAVDEAIIYPIFPSAREVVDSTVSSQILADEINKIGGNAKYFANGEKLIEYVCRTVSQNEVIFTVGAGNLYELHQQLIGCLSQKTGS